MDDACRPLSQSSTNRAAWILLIAGGALGGILTYGLTHEAFRTAEVPLWSAAAAGLTAIAVRLFFADSGWTITILARYRRWKPVWAVLLMIVGICTGAGMLLAFWGLKLWLEERRLGQVLNEWQN